MHDNGSWGKQELLRSAKPFKKNKILGVAALWLVLILIDLLAAHGVVRLKFDHGLDRIFSGGGERYDDFSTYLEKYGAADGVLILVKGEDLAAPTSTAALIDLALDLQLMEGIDAVYSPFSVPIPTADQGALTLEGLPGDPTRTWREAHAVQPDLSRVLTLDRQSALITVIGPTDGMAIARIEALATMRLAEPGISHRLTGLPVALDRSSTYLLQDFVRLNVVGAIFGILVAVIALNGWWVAVTTLLSAGTALLWGVGALGWLGAEINVISVALPVLVLALCLSDAVHLGMEQRTMLRSSSVRPILETLLRIGPAVLLTSLTTAIAFLSLGLSGSDAISQMGTSGALAVLAASCGVLLANTALGAAALLLLGRERLAEASSGAPRRFCNWFWLARFGIAADRPVAVTGLLLTVVACVAYILADTRFSLYENLRETDPVVQTMQDIESSFGAVSTLQITVDLAGENPVTMARTVSARVEAAAPELTPFSIATIADMAATSGMELTELTGQLPELLRKRLEGIEADQTIVTVPFHYQNSAQTRALTAQIEVELSTISRASGANSVQVSGPEVMSAFVSKDMIRALSLSLLFAIGAVGLIIALWLKSVKAGVLALAANILPVALVGAALGATGLGVSFAAGIAMTLAFGIAVDDTIHVMNRFRLTSAFEPQRLVRAMQDVTPPVVVTSMVLVGGLFGAFGANLPTVEEFGGLAIAVFLLALIADLAFLPALMKWSRL